jgi:hypothetical protein
MRYPHSNGNRDWSAEDERQCRECPSSWADFRTAHNLRSIGERQSAGQLINVKSSPSISAPNDADFDVLCGILFL